MAAAKTQTTHAFLSKPRKKRKGIHAKTKSSQNPKSKTHKKRKVGQGR